MEKDVLRKQVFDEVQSQFETKLKEAKRLKTEAEEELEAASERWRTERRRLNSEIDRLESALIEAKEAPRRKGDKQAGIDPTEVTRLQVAADEKLKAAAAEWETERVRLTSQVSRLERAVADTIERSNNPIRSTQPIREHFEAKLDDASKQRIEIEQQYLRAKADWDEEKKKLTGEIIKLRRLAPPSKALEAKEKLERARGRRETIEEGRIRELETRLSEANADIQRYHQAAANSREETRNQFQPRLEDAYRERVKAEEQLAAATQKWEAEKHQLHDQLAQLQQTIIQTKKPAPAPVENASGLQTELQELARTKAAVDAELERQRGTWSAERKQLLAEMDQLERSHAESAKSALAASRADLAEADKRVGQLEQRLAERSNIEEQLSSATKRWEKERNQLQEEIKQLQESRTSKRDKEQVEAKLQDMIRSRAQAENEFESQREDWAAERRRLSSEIERVERAAAEAAKAARVARDAELAETNQRIGALERQLRQLEAEKKQMEDERARRESELVQEAGFKSEQVSRERSSAVERLQGETERWELERKRLQAEVQRLQRTLAETRQNVSGEVVDQLRRQYDQKLQDMIAQKTQLTKELEAASSTLKSERARFAEEVSRSKVAVAGSNNNVDTKLIDAEVMRVEAMIREISTLIDDPATELSTVIRKNVEKAELDAYLKGILYSLGRGKAMP